MHMQVKLILVILLVVFTACRQKPERRAPDSASGTYCDKKNKVQINVSGQGKALAYIRPGVAPLTMLWDNNANGYYAEILGRAYKLAYLEPDFELSDCKTPYLCKPSRMVHKCN